MISKLKSRKRICYEFFYFFTHKIGKRSTRTTTENNHRHHFNFVHFEELSEAESYDWHEQKLNEGSNGGANGLFREFEDLARLHCDSETKH